MLPTTMIAASSAMPRSRRHCRRPPPPLDPGMGGVYRGRYAEARALRGPARPGASLTSNRLPTFEIWVLCKTHAGYNEQFASPFHPRRLGGPAPIVGSLRDALRCPFRRSQRLLDFPAGAVPWCSLAKHAALSRPRTPVRIRSGPPTLASGGGLRLERWPSPVDGDGLENRYGCKPIVGSNPTLSASCATWPHRRRGALHLCNGAVTRAGTAA